MERISFVCFGASYALALGLETLRLVWPRPVLRVLGLLAGVAGLLAQTLYLAAHFLASNTGRPLATQAGSMLFLAWILAIFYLYGSLHYRRMVWGVFVLPLVLCLVGLAWAVTDPAAGLAQPEFAQGEVLWRTVHGWLLVLAGVGVSVGFVASLMYLVQAHRLKSKVISGPNQRLFSLERLETMNRRAINWSFVLLTAGVLVGVALMIQGRSQLRGWTDPRIIGAAILWAVYVLLLYLRYGVHLQGRRLAQLTIVAFVLLLFTLAAGHNLSTGVQP